MHALYVEQCAEADPPMQPVKEKVYRNIFCNDFNYAFFHPKKDQCSTCSKYEMLKGDDKENFRAEFEAHRTRKEQAQAAKTADKARATAERAFVSATFDF
jgi:hypothetical protein